jgi:hypothetical protein
MEWVIDRNMPFCEVESDLTRKMSNLEPICAKTMKKCMNQITQCVEGKIRDMLPIKFGLVFDGWTESESRTHYVGIFAVFLHEEQVTSPMLGFGVLENETSFDSDAHVAYFIEVLQLYNRSIDSVFFLCGDNCQTNRLIATKMNVPLVGCASHRLNLAANLFWKITKYYIQRFKI